MSSVPEEKRDIERDRAVFREAFDTPHHVARKSSGDIECAIIGLGGTGLHYLTRTVAAEARVGELEGALERAIERLTIHRQCPPGMECQYTFAHDRPQEVCEKCWGEWLSKGEEH